MDNGELAELHASASVFEGHSDDFSDVAWRRAAGEHKVLQRRHLPELRAGGVDAMVANVVVEPVYRPYQAAPRALQMFGAALDDLAECGETFRIVRTGGDFARAAAANQIALVVGLEGGDPVEFSTESLRVFWEIGVRSLILAWNYRNLLAEGAFDFGSGGGLSVMGERIVHEADRLGIVIDVSHLPPAAVRHVLRVTKRPVIASHTNAAALFEHPRNLPDAELRAIGASGGVIGVVCVRALLASGDATIDHVVAQIEYLLNLVGDRHVGIGTDFNAFMRTGEAGTVGEVFTHGFRPTKGFSEWRHFPDLTRRLVERGHSADTVKGVLGDNFTRFFTRALG